MVRKREKDPDRYYKYQQEWKKIVQEYNQTIRDKLVDFFVENQEVGDYFRRLKENTPRSDFLMLRDFLDTFGEMKKKIKEVMETGELADLDLPFVFGDEQLAEDFITHIRTLNEDKFRDYQNSYANDWQREWFSSLGEMQTNLHKVRLQDFPRNPLFLIDVYLSEFELFHQILLKPFLKTEIPEKQYTYQESLDRFIICIRDLQGIDEYRDEVIALLSDIFDKDLRNCLVKHNYIMDLKTNEIRLFSPDALVGSYKEKGKITYPEFIKKIMLLKAVFWTLIHVIYSINHQTEELRPIVGESVQFNELISTFLHPNAMEVLEEVVVKHKELRDGIFDFQQVNNQEILIHQLKESWLSLRLLIVTYLDPAKIPYRKTLTHFSELEQLILMEKVMKSWYILLYEEMMQTIVHPMGLIIQKRISKTEALEFLRDLKNQKFQPLFTDLHKDLRDSLAHNSYYLAQESFKWVYYKKGERVAPNEILNAFGIFYNYQNLINVIFPGLMEISDELVIAQTLMDITKKDNISDPKFWETRETRMLNLDLLYWGAVSCVKKALCYCQQDKPAKASKILSELDYGVYEDLTDEEFESLIGWGIIHSLTPKTRMIPTSLAKRLLKRMRKGSIDHVIERRCVFVQLFSSMQTRSYGQIKKFERILNGNQ